MEKIIYKNTDEIVYYEKLENGLEVYMYPNDTAKNYYLTLNTRYGSMDTEFKLEKDKKFTSIPQGTAHFLEHQLFQEEGGHTAFEKFAKLGSSVNAFTTYNLTCYEVIASENFSENLNLLLDYVQNPVFKSQSVNSEKGIIKEEIKMYDDTPNAVLNYGLEYNLNVKDKHKYLISGTLDDIKAVSPEVLYSAYDAFYQPENMFLVLTGKFKPLEALGIIKKNQASKEFKPFEKIIRKTEKEPIKVSKSYEKRYMDVGVPKLKMAYKMSKKAFGDYDELILRIYLDAILSLKFGATSDILEKLTDDNLITWDIYTSREVREDYIMISLTMESEYIEEVIELIKEELSNIKISKEEISRIKRANIANFILHFNDIISVAEDLQDDIVNYNKIQSDILDIYKSLNEKDANNIANKIDISNESIFIIDRELN